MARLQNGMFPLLIGKKWQGIAKKFRMSAVKNATPTMKNALNTENEPIHVLLIDDSLKELWLLCNRLRSDGFRLTIANDGRKGYQRAVASQPDLILLDIAMPELDGLGACRLLKADPATRHIPVIFLSAMNSPEERLRGLQLGGIDYVAKPVLPEEVVVRIRIHLNRMYGSSTALARENDVVARHPDSVVFKAAANLIRDQLDALPTLPEIARMVGTHEKKLGLIFRQRLGTTVSGFITEERIRLARRLLEETAMSVQRIAEQVGYGNAGNFTTTFRKRLGVTPTSYRQALQTREPGPT